VEGLNLGGVRYHPTHASIEKMDVTTIMMNIDCFLRLQAFFVIYFLVIYVVDDS